MTESTTKSADVSFCPKMLSNPVEHSKKHQQYKAIHIVRYSMLHGSAESRSQSEHRHVRN